MGMIFGIDLGTTNSEIAYVKEGRPLVVPMSNGKLYLPSVVGLDSRGTIITGVPARNQYAAFPENTVVSVKREMGSGKKVTMGGKDYSPAEISSHIIKSLIEAAESETGSPVEKAVISVPAYFSDIQRQETIQAGELAGLEVVRIINEPTAAALAYGCREDQPENILVYDFGGGTFDVSLIEVEEGVIEDLATDGDSRLGGDDIDRLLVKLLMARLPQGLPEKDLHLEARLKNLAESVKITLSNKTLVQVREEFLATIKGKPVNLESKVSRQDLEARMEGLLSKTFTLVKEVMRQAKIKATDISKVLLVGGSTYIPLIFRVLRDDLKLNVHREVDPTYCVAIGAAIQGAIIDGKEVDTILVDVNSHSLGIRCLGFSRSGDPEHDYFSIIVPKNTPIPASMSETYCTLVDNQPGVDIKVYQGEDPLVTNNTLVGSFRMELPAKLPSGSDIDVTFEYNLNGIVEVSAVHRKSARQKKLKVDVQRLKVLRAG